MPVTQLVTHLYSGNHSTWCNPCPFVVWIVNWPNWCIIWPTKYTYISYTWIQSVNFLLSQSLEPKCSELTTSWRYLWEELWCRWLTDDIGSHDNSRLWWVKPKVTGHCLHLCESGEPEHRKCDLETWDIITNVSIFLNAIIFITISKAIPASADRCSELPAAHHVPSHNDWLAQNSKASD